MRRTDEVSVDGIWMDVKYELIESGEPWKRGMIDILDVKIHPGQNVKDLLTLSIEMEILEKLREIHDEEAD